MLRHSFILPVVILLGISVQAMIYQKTLKSFKQPDGSTVDVYLYGAGEVIAGESADGYTVMRNSRGWMSYASLNREGELEASRFIYRGGNWNSPRFARHLRPKTFGQDLRTASFAHLPHRDNINSLHKGLGKQQKDLAEPFYKTPGGDVTGLVLMVDFPDQPGLHPVENYHEFLNGDNYSAFGNRGSVKEFYQDVSNGMLNFTNDIFGVYRMPKNKSYYDAPLESRARRFEFIKTILEHFEPLVNFEDYDQDGDGEVDIIAIVYAGSGNEWSKGIWPHRGTYMGRESYDGKRIKAYQMTDQDNELGIFVFAHEVGHQIFGWPDLYGTGAHGIMAARPDDQRPLPPNDVYRADQGWIETVDFDQFSQGAFDIERNGNLVYRYINSNANDEFFLWANRHPEGRWSLYDGSGILMYRFDHSQRRNKIGEPFSLTVIQADGLWELDVDKWVYPASEQADVFEAGGQDSFTDYTSPAARWGDSSATGIWIEDITPPGATMSFSIGAPLNVIYGGLASVNGPDTIFNAGETAQLQVGLHSVNARTGGQMYLEATGANVQYISSIGSALQVTPIAAGGTFNGTIPITAAANTPFETKFFFDLTYTDGGTVKTRVVTVDAQPYPVVAMSGKTEWICDVLYTDPGGTSNYSENLDMVQTVFAGKPGHRAEFEFRKFYMNYSEETCENDYVNIYDGRNTQAPLIDKFCYNDTLETIVPTNQWGALTFEIHTDDEFNSSGWEAIVHCVVDENVTEINPDVNLLNPQLMVRGRTVNLTGVYGQTGITLDLYQVQGKLRVKGMRPLTRHNQLRWVLDEGLKGLYVLKVRVDGKNLLRKVILN